MYFLKHILYFSCMSLFSSLATLSSTFDRISLKLKNSTHSFNYHFVKMSALSIDSMAAERFFLKKRRCSCIYHIISLRLCRFLVQVTWCDIMNFACASIKLSFAVYFTICSVSNDNNNTSSFDKCLQDGSFIFVLYGVYVLNNEQFPKLKS